MSELARRQWLDSNYVCFSCSDLPVTGPWLVSTPHRLVGVNGGGSAPLPWGLRHARRMGSTWTACGLPALSWRIFHESPFGSDTADECGACAHAVSHEKTAGSDGRHI